MPATATTITLTVELNGGGASGPEKLLVTLELPAPFDGKTFRDFEVATFAYATFVRNHLRRLSPDHYSRFLELTPEQCHVQLILTGAREFAYIGDQQGPHQAVTHRVPLADETWLRILARGGLQAVRHVCASYLSLFNY
jgi:hypothetical protein